MNNFLRFCLLLFFMLIAWFIGAVFHEKDLSQNFNKTGDARAWFYEIKR